MSAEVISMKEWERAQFIDAANRLLIHFFLQMPKSQRERVLKDLKDFAQNSDRENGA